MQKHYEGGGGGGVGICWNSSLRRRETSIDQKNVLPLPSTAMQCLHRRQMKIDKNTLHMHCFPQKLNIPFVEVIRIQNKHNLKKMRFLDFNPILYL